MEGGSQHHGRAHFASAELEGERFAAAERLGELIERREQLVSELSEIAIEMTTCEERIRSFD
jgi:hypothetical protein